ncbi:MAG: hypothetical protein IJ608_06125 [Lachnospiraceae bacterium]|nr:hypothetical protein [Lachnospiraceae bacterium]
MGTIEILTKLKRKIMENPATAKSVPVEDIIKAVYTEAYGLRQLYSDERFAQVEKKIGRFAEGLKVSIEADTPKMTLQVLQSIIDSLSLLPDSIKVQDYIEEANFNRARIDHILQRTFIVLGDSHVNFFSGNEDLSFIPIGHDINTCEQVNGLIFTTLHLGPCLAYNCRKYETRNRFREKLEYLEKEFIVPGSRIITVMGEIDIRVHVFKEAAKQNRSYESIVEDITKNYFTLLMDLKNKGFDVYCFGPIATQKDDCPIEDEYPRVGSEVERNKATKYFTDEMKKMCDRAGIIFMSIFDKMITEDYRTIDTVISKDKVHLGQAALPLVMEEFKKLST